MSATPLEVKEDELARGRAEVAPEVSTGMGGEAGGGGPEGPPPPARESGGGRDGRRPPRWWKLELLAVVLCMMGALLGVWASVLRRRWAAS